MELADRESALLQEMATPDAPYSADAYTSEISGVDFARPLSSIDNMDIPFSTDSLINKFAHLVLKMLSACDSGSTGGDAARMTSVLNAAIKEVNACMRRHGAEAKAEGFQRLLGLTLAIPMHRAYSFFYRGDREFARELFKTMGKHWKNLFKTSAERYGQPLHEYALEYCEHLADFLKTTEYPGLRFTYLIKTRQPRKKTARKASELQGGCVGGGAGASKKKKHK